MTVEHYVGLMSGTSLDGVDAVLAVCEDDRWRFPIAHHVAFPNHVRAEALALHDVGSNELHRAALLGNRLAELYGQAITALLDKTGVSAKDVAAIGCHGQTVRHAPGDGYTLQLNNPARLAELTGITVVADFRSRDIAAGGQGAPLVPAFHDALFRTADRHRVILNIGGIANLTDLAAGRPTIGFDCGPGNMLLDAWVHRHLGLRYDDDGRWAGQGKVLQPMLDRLLAHPFLALPPPKSGGREQFNLVWLDQQLAGGEKPEDVQATLLAFTTAATADAITRHCGGASELHVCGGGARNTVLMRSLGERLPSCRIATTADLGLPVDWVEAAAFAWLARRTLRKEAGNLPAVTGARGSRILGAIYPA